jgi:hypothetical protein
MKKLRLTSSSVLTVLALGLALSGSASAVFAASAPAEKKAAATGKPKPYPLTVCLVTDNDLGSMGEETTLNYNGQLIKFCCKPCEAKFLKDPAKFLAKLPASDATPAKK